MNNFRASKALPTFSFLVVALLSFSANAATIKLFYNENGTRGWKGGFRTVAECHEAAKRNRYTVSQYYCSESQSIEMERRLGWRR
jgi:hypothetical protein